MNAKHYVSLEAAKKLKELGYDDEYQVHYYNNNGEIVTPWCSDDDDENLHFPCPTLLEAMDWLESKGIHIEIRMMHCKVKGDPYKIAPDDEYQWKWYFVICKGDDVKHPIVKEDEDGYVVMRTNRNMCINEAIRKGLDLL